MTNKPCTHWIATAGLAGYMPNYIVTLESYDDAVDSLIELHELPQDLADDLRENGFLGVDLQEYGNEVMNVIQCDCDTPEQHND